MAVQDDCMDPEEFELLFETWLQREIAVGLGSDRSALDEIGSRVDAEIGDDVPPGATSMFVGDVDGVNLGDVFFVVP